MTEALGEVEEPRRKPRWAEYLVAASWVVLAALLLTFAVWSLRLGESIPLVWMGTSVLHVVLLAAWPILVVGVALRRWGLAIVASVTIVAQFVVIWPMLPRHQGGSMAGISITVESLNLYVDNPNLDAAARQLATHLPGVLVVQEFTPAAATAFRRSGLSAKFRYRMEHPDPGTTGEAIYSRFPLQETTSPAASDDMTVVVALPGGHHLHVIDVHSFGPQPGDPGVWERELHRLDHALDTTPRPWVAIGDYNATFDHRVYRDLLHSGRHDAHLMTGRGTARSWPSSKPVPPLVLIDHAIMSAGIGAAATGERTIAGSDHRMIKVELRLNPRRR